jgi:hypothetical protein
MSTPNYQIVSGATTVQFISNLTAAAQQGWLIIGSVIPSGSGFTILMTMADVDYRGNPLTQSVAPSSSLGAGGIWSIVYPPQSATDTLLGINTDPNVNAWGQIHRSGQDV